jgi:hypothetical protein
MNNFEIVSVAGKGVKLEFDTAEDADKFVERMMLLGQKGYPMWVDDEVKQLVYDKNKSIVKKLLRIPKLAESGNIDDNIKSVEFALEAIDHIEWLERFFYPIVTLNGE